MITFLLILVVIALFVISNQIKKIYTILEKFYVAWDEKNNPTADYD